MTTLQARVDALVRRIEQLPPDQPARLELRLHLHRALLVPDEVHVPGVDIMVIK